MPTCSHTEETAGMFLQCGVPATCRFYVQKHAGGVVVQFYSCPRHHGEFRTKVREEAVVLQNNRIGVVVREERIH